MCAPERARVCVGMSMIGCEHVCLSTWKYVLACAHVCVSNLGISIVKVKITILVSLICHKFETKALKLLVAFFFFF